MFMVFHLINWYSILIQNCQNICINRPPALEEPNISKLVADNLNAMHSARKAFSKRKFRETHQST